MKITFVAAGNGFGHLKRVCTVISQIFQSAPETTVYLIGATAHLGVLERWGITQVFSKYSFEFINGSTEHNLMASHRSDYKVDTYQRSCSIISGLIKFTDPDKIISDNLVGVLYDHPETILMGSFLFQDTLAHRGPELDLICNWEVELLKKYRPKMLGLTDMVMPGVLDKTDFVGLPWFCDRKGYSDEKLFLVSEKKQLLITGGGTPGVTEKLLDIIRVLYRQKEFVIHLDSSLYNLVAKHQKKMVTHFPFTDQAFQALDWIICRPGIGILTDAVQFGVPVCTVYEADLEMQHNASCAHALGWGLDINDYTPDQLIQVFNRDTAPLKKSMMRLETGGAHKAAHYILNR
ncbi:MAG: hypothetical protein KF856_13825 [Cyclobacteriaceae bacterium]|nr:hypothetical protein [Cyclobacteriaceae bacterium]